MLISSFMTKTFVLIWYLFALSDTRQITPINYKINMSPLSIHGSSESGHCSNTSVTMDGGQVCTTPQSSVLFDGVIPSLTGRNNNLCWASQLLVLALGGTITFEFSPPGSGALNNIEAFEVIMLNCPQELMEAQVTVRLELGTSVCNVKFDKTSCDYLIRVCESFSPITANTITLSYLVPVTVNLPAGYYFAEVSFYNTRRSDCPSSSIVNTSPSSATPTCSPTTMTSVSKDFTTANTKSSSRSTETPISTDTTIMKRRGDNSTTSTITNSSTSISIVPIIIVIVTIVILISVTVPLILLIVFRKKICGSNWSMLHYFQSAKGSSTTIENYQAIEKLPDGSSGYEMRNDKKYEDSYDTYTQVFDKEVNDNGKEGETPFDCGPVITELYAEVDKTKTKKSKAVDASSTDISDMYAIVDKKTKKNRKKIEVNENQDNLELYSVVDKSKKKKTLNKIDVDAAQMYSAIDKTRSEEDKNVSQLYAAVHKPKKQTYSNY